MLAVMKIIGSLAAEIGNLLLLTRYTNVNSVVGGYASLSIVARADNYMALTLQDYSISAEMSSYPIMYKKH